MLDIAESYVSIFTGSRDDLAKARMEVCRGCVRKMQFVNICLACGCPLKGKTRTIKNPCDKWPATLK